MPGWYGAVLRVDPAVFFAPMKEPLTGAVTWNTREYESERTPVSLQVVPALKRLPGEGRSRRRYPK
jgi:hypothetical protein